MYLMQEGIKEMFLSNGLQVVHMKDLNVNNVLIKLFVKVGSVYESSKNNGISHFNEHMLFEGTRNRNTLDIMGEIERNGGEINAFTKIEFTQYSIGVPANCLEIALDVLSDIIINSLFSKKGIEKQRNVIIMEREEQLDDLSRNLYTSLLGISYKHNPISYPVVGWRDTISQISRKDIFKHYKKYYVPQNAVLMLYGNFEELSALELISKYFSKWVGNTISCKDIKEPIFHPSIFIEKSDRSRVKALMMWDGLNYSNIKQYNCGYTIGSNILNNHLKNVLRFDKGLVYDVYVTDNPYSNAGHYMLGFNTDRRNLIECLKIIEDIISHRIPLDIFERSKNLFIESRKKDKVIELNEYANSILYGHPYESFEEYIERATATQIWDVDAAANHIFSKKFSLGISGNVTLQLENEIKDYYQKIKAVDCELNPKS